MDKTWHELSLLYENDFLKGVDDLENCSKAAQWAFTQWLIWVRKNGAHDPWQELLSWWRQRIDVPRSLSYRGIVEAAQKFNVDVKDVRRAAQTLSLHEAKEDFLAGLDEMDKYQKAAQAAYNRWCHAMSVDTEMDRVYYRRVFIHSATKIGLEHKAPYKWLARSAIDHKLNPNDLREYIRKNPNIIKESSEDFLRGLDSIDPKYSAREAWKRWQKYREKEFHKPGTLTLFKTNCDIQNTKSHEFIAGVAKENNINPQEVIRVILAAESELFESSNFLKGIDSIETSMTAAPNWLKLVKSGSSSELKEWYKWIQTQEARAEFMSSNNFIKFCRKHNLEIEDVFEAIRILCRKQ